MRQTPGQTFLSLRDAGGVCLGADEYKAGEKRDQTSVSW